MNINQKGLAGEFYTLAQLTARGYNASLTLGNTKGVDILVMNEKNNIGYKIEVKTTQEIRGPKSTRPISWLLSKKNETYIDSNLIYCFVLLEHLETMPRFFLVKSKDVAKLISEQHREWLNMPRAEGKTVIDGNLRKFKIDLDDPHGYENNWELLDPILKSMRRGTTKEKTTTLLKKFRAEVPGIILRTSLIVGYPGETEEDFETLKAWVKEMRF